MQDPFSRRFAERLFAVYPEWRALARRDPNGPSDPGSLLLIVESPVVGRPLMVRTYGHQVTVDFGPDGWHEHFPASGPGDDERAIDDAMAFLGALMRDELVLVTRTLFRRLRWTRCIASSRVRPPRFGRTDVISWSGRQDKTLFPAPRPSA